MSQREKGKEMDNTNSTVLYLLNKDIEQYRLSQQKGGAIQKVYNTQHTTTKAIQKQILSQSSASSSLLTSKQAEKHLSSPSLQKPILPPHFSSATQSFIQKPITQKPSKPCLQRKQTSRSLSSFKQSHTQNIRSASSQHTQLEPPPVPKNSPAARNQEGETSRDVMRSLK